MVAVLALFFFFFNDTATTEIYTLSLHDALPISEGAALEFRDEIVTRADAECHDSEGGVLARIRDKAGRVQLRSEEHTSELQSHSDLVCRLLLEKKKKKNKKEYRYIEHKYGHTLI